MLAALDAWSAAALQLLAAAEAGSSSSHESTPVWAQILVPVLTSIIGVLGAALAALLAGARKARRAREEEGLAFQLEYLGPLQLAAESLAWKFRSIESKIRARQPGSGGLDWMLHTFHCVKEPREILGRPPSQAEYASWCNGEGYFAVSTIYALGVYLLQARRARREGPRHVELVRRLEDVRLALGHEFGVYVMIQDSIGEYLGDDRGMPMSYRRFCAKLLDDDERPWFLNALDYFREIDKKTPEQRRRIRSALGELLRFLSRATALPVGRALLEDEGGAPEPMAAAG